MKKILAAAIAALMFAVLLAAFVSGGDIDEEQDDNLSAADSLYLITPADYRLVFQPGNPILFGIRTMPGTALIYLESSGLTGGIMLFQAPYTYIFHFDAPENPGLYELTLSATNDDRVEELTLQIYVGAYHVTIQLGDKVTDGEEDEDDHQCPKKWWPFPWYIIALFIILIICLAALVII